MKLPELVRLVLAAAVPLVLSACASAGGGGGEPETAEAPAAGEVVMAIDNDLIPPSSVTVYIVPESGGRRRLGNISGGAQQTFNYDPPSEGLEYRLVAEVVGGNERSSDSFNLVGGATRVEWSTSRTQVVVR